MFSLITFLSGSPDSYPSARLKEFDFAASQNLLNPHIQTVTLVHDWPETHPLIKSFGERGVHLECFANLIGICNQVPRRRTVLCNLDTFFPVNSGLGALVNVDLQRHLIVLTPYVYCNGRVRDQYFSGVTRPYRDQKIKLHGLDGRAVASWIFETPVKVDAERLRGNVTENLEKFASGAARQLTDALRRHRKTSNPSLEIVTIRMHDTWHPRLDWPQLDRPGLLPCTLAEIGRRVEDASSAVSKMPVELQQFTFNGTRMVKIPPNPFTKGVPFKLPDPLAGLRQRVEQDRSRNNGVAMTRRLWHPEQVTGAFAIAQRRGKATLTHRP